MEVEMVMVCSREGAANPNIGPFTPELGVRLRGDRKKAAKSTVFISDVKSGFINSVKSVFINPALSQFSLAVLSQKVTVNAGRDRGGATTRLRYRRALNVSVSVVSAAQGGRGHAASFSLDFASAQVRLSKFCGLLLPIRPPTRVG